jgi:diacylglycerol kinase (ATP)
MRMPRQLQTPGHALALGSLWMRICLFFNETAGGGISLDALTSHITRAGHHIDRVVGRDEDLRAHLHDGFDCVAAAGGDGTIGRAARALAGGAMPLAVLPLGTANNIATSLALDSDIDRLIAGWEANRIAKIDLGVVEANGRQQYFLESVGCGLVADSIDTGRRTLSKDDPDTHLEHARQLYLDIADQSAARRYSMRIGDETVEGDFLLIEALNTSFIGPGVQLTSSANAADGLLSVVAVTSSEKPALTAYLRALRDGSNRDAGFKSWRVPVVELDGPDRIHIDDQVEAVSGAVTIRLAPAALPLLA